MLSTWLSPAVATYAAAEARRVGEPQVEGTRMTVTVDSTQIQQLGAVSLQPLATQLALSLRSVGVREVVVALDESELERLENIRVRAEDGSVISVGPQDTLLTAFQRMRLARARVDAALDHHQRGVTRFHLGHHIGHAQARVGEEPGEQEAEEGDAVFAQVGEFLRHSCSKFQCFGRQSAG